MDKADTAKVLPLTGSDASTSKQQTAHVWMPPAYRAKPGHFDELFGLTSSKLVEQTTLQVSSAVNSQSQSQSQSQSEFDGGSKKLGQPWQQFFDFLGPEGVADLDQRAASLRKQIINNGVTYNVYADANGPQRPWSLDLFPLIIPADDWAHIEAGIQQRTRLLNAIMADVYGPQTLITRGLLPVALVQGHPGYLRGMQGVQPADGKFLHIAAFDLARGPDGQWHVVSQRTQAPSGLGYLLENRSSISMLFPEAFHEMRVERLAESYEALVSSLKALCQGNNDGNSRIVLLTSGPYNETYFEHAYLARYLGLSLVEGNDLLVRGEHLYLKTLQGLEPVHGVLKRLDDEFLDPLELRADSTLGVPGLLQAIRAGNVQMANAPGSAFLESSALLGFLPALARDLLGESLSLPSLSTWWCGEQAVMQRVLAQLQTGVIKPTYPATGMASVMGHTLDERSLDEWAGRMVRAEGDYTVQAFIPLAQTPTWQGSQIAPRSAMLRVFALPDGCGGWRVLPGGLARLAGKDNHIASMQYGGSSADVWVLSDNAATPGTAAVDAPLASAVVGYRLTATAVNTASDTRRKQPVTSRAAENLFWLGRYSERSENSLRLAQLTLHCLAGDDQPTTQLLAWLSELATSNSLVLPSVPPAGQARRVFERALIAALAETQTNASVGFNLSALKEAASAVRERLSQEQWQVIVMMERDFFRRCAPFVQPEPDYNLAAALSTLDSASNYLAAITGAQTDRMMRDDGWRLLSIGRHIERLTMLSGALATGFETRAVLDGYGFNAMVALFDSTITFHAQYQQRRDLPALLDLLVLDQDNPRSLTWVLRSLKNRLGKLLANTTQAGSLPDPVLQRWVDVDFPDLADSLRTAVASGELQELVVVFNQCRSFGRTLSDLLSQRYFSHAGGVSVSLNA